MNQRASALWAQLRAHRPAYTLSILLTLTLGILIGTVISYGVKGQDKKAASSSDAAMLSVPSPQVLSNQFSLPRDFSPLSRSPADSAQWFVNNATLLHFEAGEAPVAYAFADSGPIQELFCTVSGRDIVLP